MEKGFLQEPDSDRSLMTAICYSGPTSVVPTNEHLLEEKKKTCAKVQSGILQTEGLSCSIMYGGGVYQLHK